MSFALRLPDELAPAANEPVQTFYEASRGGDRQAASVPEMSTKVGWSLRDKSGRIVDAFAFVINPQGLNRTSGSRTTLSATRAGFYVDDFGPAPTSIQLRQLVASGKVVTGGVYTAREDVQRFIKTIYEPATSGNGRTRYRVFFHDHHFQRGFEERVFFPAGALTIQRSVDLHHVWALDLQMVGLEKFPYAEIEADPSAPRARQTRPYRVKKGDTLDRIVARAAGPRASSTKKKRVRAQILELNPHIRKKRVVQESPNVVKIGKPMKVYAGELLLLPA